MTDDKPITITAEEFDLWLTPKTALAVLKPHMEWQTATAAIINRLIRDDMRAAARRSVLTERGAETPLKPYWLIPKNYWVDTDQEQTDNRFWTTGDMVFVPPVQANYTYSRPSIACVEIRFDREGIARLLPQAIPVLAPLTSNAPPPIRPISHFHTVKPRDAPLEDGMVSALRQEIDALRMEAFGGKAAPGPLPTSAQLDLTSTIPTANGPVALMDLVPATLGDVARSTQAASSPQLVPRPRANPVSPREIAAWNKTLTKTQKTLGVLALWALAKEYYPGRHLPRKMVELYGKNRGTGHRSEARSSPKTTQ